ncbi:MAG: isochorismate synthase MenF [Sandaracinaceae bacterium]
MTAVALSATRPVTPHKADARAFLLDALRRLETSDGLGVIRLSAPLAPIEAMSAALRKGIDATWQSPDGHGFAAHGATSILRLDGPDRFTALEPRAAALFSRMRRITQPGTPDRAPRLFGGWAFAEGSADALPWDGFGDGAFFLPRWSYERTPDGHAALTLSVELDRVSHKRIENELDTVWESLTRPLPSPKDPEVLRTDHVPLETWTAQVDAITAAIGEGRFEKVVAARRATVFANHDFAPWQAAHRLRHRYPDTWCFSFRMGAGTFVGATPERLFVKRGQTLETDALAGSIAVGDARAESTLRASLKDRREHRPVVEHLLHRLSPLCETMKDPTEPRVRRLPNVLHLHTTIRGSLRQGVHAAQLASALHPTPAVGGVPSVAATEWIQDHEAHPRGWYAGPVGWIDADGDAELTVALRCGVIRGNTAWVWAGGGIVDGSEPDAEWREASWKLAPVLAALGADT